jgi:hypothetical protein
LKAQSQVVLVVVAVVAVEPLVVVVPADPLVVVATVAEVDVVVPPSGVLSEDPLEQAIGATAIALTERPATKIHPMRNF